MQKVKKLFKYSPNIKTERLILVELKPGLNFDNYLKWVNDLPNKHFLATSKIIYNEQSLNDYVRETHENESTVMWGIFFGNIHIGNVKVTMDKKKLGEFVLGILIARDYTKIGIGEESIKAVINEIRLNNQTRNFKATIMKGNEASQKLFSKIGFKSDKLTFDSQIIELTLDINN